MAEITTYYRWHIDELGRWLLAKSKDYHIDIFGFLSNGKGDLIFRMGLYALATGDPEAIKLCIALLNQRKRWPDSLNHPNDARNRFDKWISKTNHRLDPEKYPYVKFRWQHGMTRDPFVTVFAAIYWHQYEMIQDLNVPLYIMNPAFYYWVKFIKTTDPEMKQKFEWWQSVNIAISSAGKYHGYVQHLNSIMAFIARSEIIKKQVLATLPRWNYMCRCLCGDTLNAEETKAVFDYKGHTGWRWTASELLVRPTLGPGEPIDLEKELLMFAFNNKGF